MPVASSHVLPDSGRCCRLPSVLPGRVPWRSCTQRCGRKRALLGSSSLHYRVLLGCDEGLPSWLLLKQVRMFASSRFANGPVMAFRIIADMLMRCLTCQKFGLHASTCSLLCHCDLLTKAWSSASKGWLDEGGRKGSYLS